MVKIQSQIEDALQMIRASKITLRPFSIYTLTIVDGGPKKIISTLSEGSFADGKKYTNLAYAVIGPLFTIVDALANEVIPDKSDSDFKIKQNCLPDSSIDQKIFKECYRILRIMRNFSVHAISSISVTDEDSILFENSSDDFTKDSRILVSKEGLNYLATYVVEYISDYKEYSIKHKREILKSYYTEFRKRLIVFEDGEVSKKPLLSIKKINAYFKIGTRFYVENPNYELVNLSKKLKITSGLPSEDDPEWQSRDYLIEEINFEDKRYLVPHEALDDNSEISITEMKEYSLN
ncbi:hypothetical protein ABQD97_20345 [Enterococcus avium]|uniref:pEK499-p136 HEPN domain-containing protein n=1 Tax=Enterococcus avium TaxID=33945 RepID=A0AAW8RZ91_ENTAV|nr:MULTISPECIES: hypothetical protein [Enterococcus]MDT2391726.1 hypothetical protein [Enterococcus avium]MDT2404800.1 hypothetical protein [Enterococcus avium]MDT2437865.1 hypothetical protein [Enterococcus avium]MDT2482657.1 hypothetical protein [Enterococcus avium]MDT2509353.1 hypothetical protein [Enterococcus avium]